MNGGCWKEEKIKYKPSQFWVFNLFLPLGILYSFHLLLFANHSFKLIFRPVIRAFVTYLASYLTSQKQYLCSFYLHNLAYCLAHGKYKLIKGIHVAYTLHCNLQYLEGSLFECIMPRRLITRCTG